MDLPSAPPYVLRARLLTPLVAGGTRHESDALIDIDASGRIASVTSSADASADQLGGAIDLRPWVVMPGMVDLHAHLPQLPNAGVGAGLDLLTWLEHYIFPLERGFDAAAAAELAPRAWRAFAAAGTTTALVYGAVYEASLDAAFRAAEAHGIRAIIGKVMMDRITYDSNIDPTTILERSLAESGRLIERWDGAADGRLRYAVTPRFAISCTADMLRESASLAAATGTYWQTHLSEDRHEIAEVAAMFPEAIDYVDVYDRAGGLSARAVLAHAVHLSDRELARLVETGSRVAHCPASNLFLASGIMPLGRYVEAGLAVGLGSDVAGGPELSLFSVMRMGFYSQHALRVAGDAAAGSGAPAGPGAAAGSGTPAGSGAPAAPAGPVLGPLDWLTMATLGGARALGLGDVIGSVEADKEADLIAVDPRFAAPLEDQAPDDDAADLASRLIFRSHPDMVRAAWVRGRALAGPDLRG